MLTDYMVTCPHCHWRGCLFAKGDREAWKPATPRVHDVVFQCERCHGEWGARVVGDDVRPLPVTEVLPVSSV